MTQFPEGLKALVVDDHDLIRKNVARVLRKLGFVEIFDCSNGKDAKTLIDSTSFDLIIADIELNFLSGFELLDHVRGLDMGSDTPFIILSGTAEKDDIVKAVDKGADEYMIKPFQSEELEAKIEKVLGQYYAPGPVLARLRLAEKEINYGQWDHARALVHEALKVKDSPRARHLEAVISLKQKRFKEAIQKLEENIQNAPSYLKNYVTLANIHIELKDFPRAIRSLSLELEINPKQPLRQIKLANMLLKEKNVMGAVNHYKQALLENAKNPEALYGMGTAYALSDNMEKSIYYFKRYRRNHPKDARPLKAVVQFCEQAGKLKMAEVVLLDERKAHPDRLDAYMLLAEFYLRHQRIEEFEASIQAALKRKPDFAPAYVMLANHLVRQKDLDGAVQTFRDLMSRSKDPNMVIYLAQLYIQTGRYSHAIAELHDSMAKRADPIKIFPYLYTATLRTKQWAKAALIKDRLQLMGVRDEKLFAGESPEDAVAERRQGKTPGMKVS